MKTKMKKNTICSALALISVASSASAATLMVASTDYTGGTSNDTDAGTGTLSLAVDGTFAGGGASSGPARFQTSTGALSVSDLAIGQSVAVVSGSIAIDQFDDGINFKIDGADVLVLEFSNYNGALTTTALGGTGVWRPWNTGTAPTIEFDSAGNLKLMVTAIAVDGTNSIAVGDRFNVLDYATPTTFNDTAFAAAIADGDFDFSLANNNAGGGGGELQVVKATFNVQIIPEPSSTALLGLGFLGLLIKRRR